MRTVVLDVQPEYTKVIWPREGTGLAPACPEEGGEPKQTWPPAGLASAGISSAPPLESLVAGEETPSLSATTPGFPKNGPEYH